MNSLHDLSATELLAAYRGKTLSPVDVARAVIERIDAWEPHLNATYLLDADAALAQAEASQARWLAGAPLGPLDGVPVTIKENIATRGAPMPLGCAATELAPAERDAPPAARLRAAGAVLVCKTTMPDYGMLSSGVSSFHGITRNPWDLRANPGGSSSGAGAAAAAGYGPLHLGTDIGGSVRLPAHFAGVCGHKPSFGVVPQLGYLDHTTGGITEADVNVFGPLARSVEDLERVFDVVAQPTTDRAVGWHLRLPASRHQRLEDFRVAAWLDDTVCPVGADVGERLDAAVLAAERAGAKVDRAARPGVELSEVFQTGLPLIAAATSPARTEQEWANLTALAALDAAAADRAAADPAAAGDGPDPVLAMRSRASVMSHRDWLLLDERRQLLRRRWADFFTRYDVLICPVAATAAFPHMPLGNVYTRTLDIDGVTRPYVDVLAWTSFIGFVYLPATVVPVGLTPSGLPVGIQLVAPYLEDRTALRFARHIEALTGGYQPPPLARLAH